MADRYILVVDDQMNNIETLGEVLGDEHDIHFALSAQQALVQISQQMPELILLDIMMPDMDGFQLCEILKAKVETRDIPIIFITSLSTPAQETRGLEAGAVDYIVKPFNASIVRARVHNHLELKRTKDLLRVLSQTDALTGLANRRRLFEHLDAVQDKALRLDQPLSVLLIDVDSFKPYNDLYGHIAGDVCLQRVAGMIQSSLRSVTDMGARYGGEEFCCVLENADQELALQIAERIRANIEALHIPHLHSMVLPIVTVSVGVASSTSSNRSLHANLLMAADKALYVAKDKGRNKVIVL
ncbi:diguanylate cyclase [Deefgea tanakiae]|jgi:diguanylate cyclase (GGDEF)-like protein|uniref:diguanylate cyclase n=1 Tax=Deefgea tanakiae TaxID=2865840 RepID=A0ABX8Z6P8_9NEIS|nr:diguanylate cyclase [Deefgea tanakiae]QZA78267.1 diguanylate cyclase [Deefgea tanakiae]